MGRVREEFLVDGLYGEVFGEGWNVPPVRISGLVGDSRLVRLY